MRVQTALNMLRDHGCKAFVCAEGVVAIGEVVWREVSPLAMRDDDRMTEEPFCFDVYQELASDFGKPAAWTVDHVDSAAVRAYLGY